MIHQSLAAIQIKCLSPSVAHFKLILPFVTIANRADSNNDLHVEA